MHLITFPLDIAFSDYYRNHGLLESDRNIETMVQRHVWHLTPKVPHFMHQRIWPCSPSGARASCSQGYRTGQQIDIQCFALKTFSLFSDSPSHAHTKNPFSNTSPQCYSTSSVSLFSPFIVQQTAYSFHKSKFCCNHK